MVMISSHEGASEPRCRAQGAGRPNAASLVRAAEPRRRADGPPVDGAVGGVTTRGLETPRAVAGRGVGTRSARRARDPLQRAPAGAGATDGLDQVLCQLLERSHRSPRKSTRPD